MRCSICGTKIKPWFEECFECHNSESRSNKTIQRPIFANQFMKEMKIDGW